MKYVMIENGIVVSDVKNLLESKVADYSALFVSVEGLSPFPAINDVYNEDGSFTAGTPPTLGPIEARELRDAYLKNSDWIMVAHAEGAFEDTPGFDIEEWRSFRSTLRALDLPKGSEELVHSSDLFPVRPLYPMYRPKG
jgi:hypothetical protein